MSSSHRPAVFLDRDGVINDVTLRDGKSYPPASAAALEIYPCAAPAIDTLQRHGLPVFVVTNQPDVGTGIQSELEVERMHRRLLAELAIDAIFVCFHTDADACECRKPAPGMLLHAAEIHGIDLSRSFVVGDRWRDIEAGERAGCTTLWIDRGYRERAPKRPDHQVCDLGEAAQIIAARTAGSPRVPGRESRGHVARAHYTIPTPPPLGSASQVRPRSIQERGITQRHRHCQGEP